MPADGRRYESFSGVLTVTPAPGRTHQRAVARLLHVLGQAAPSEVEVLPAPYDWWVSSTEWYEPDVVVFHRAAPSDRRLEVPPLLAIEVTSPSTRLHDLNAKRAAYAANKCPAYWIVDPDEPSVVALQLEGQSYREVVRAVGHDRFEVTKPFPVSFTAAQLVAS